MMSDIEASDGLVKDSEQGTWLGVTVGGAWRQRSKKHCPFEGPQGFPQAQQMYLIVLEHISASITLTEMPCNFASC